jgi:hypothetical protein
MDKKCRVVIILASSLVPDPKTTPSSLLEESFCIFKLGTIRSRKQTCKTKRSTSMKMMILRVP